MALPLQVNSQVFSQDQKIHFRASYWNSTSTAVRISAAHPSGDRMEAFGSGLEFAMFDLYDSTWNPTYGTIEADLENQSYVKSVLGYTGADYRTGIVPNIYKYWGGGAPEGGGKSRSVVMKFSGYVTENSGPAGSTLVFAGQGHVMVVWSRSGVVLAEVINGKMKEPNPRPNMAVGFDAKGDFGYQFSTPLNLVAGDKLDIYYWHNGEPWGGIAGKVLNAALSTDAATFLQQIREAPVIGTSFMAKEQTPIAASPIRYLKNAELTRGAGAVTEMSLTVPLASLTEPNGYVLDTVIVGPAAAHSILRDNVDGSYIRKGRAVHLEAGYIRPDGSEELYPRFTGYIDDIETNEETATIKCRSFDGRMTEVHDENIPDRLDYHASGFILRGQSTEPVFGIPAADNWPLETITLVMAAKAGIDHYNFGLSAAAVSDHGKSPFQSATTFLPYYGQRLFQARALGDQTKLVQLERQANYGNVMPLYKEYLPTDDEYLFPPEVTQRIYDRVRSFADHYGYDFYFNAEGQCVLTGRNNPVAFQYATKTGSYTTVASGTEYQQVRLSAVGGLVMVRSRFQDPTWSRIIEGKFSRLDLYYGIGQAADALNGGKINYVIERSTGVVENLLTYSEQFDNSAWVKDASTVVANVALGPTGTMTADRITFSGGDFGIYQQIPNQTGQRTVSVWLKSEDGGYYSFRLGQQAYSSNTDIVIAVTPTWQRFEMPLTHTGATSYFTLRRVSGDTNTRVVLAWGAQINSGGAASTYAPTTNESFTGAAWVTVGSGQIDTAAAIPESYFYDNILRADGSNAAVTKILQLPFDHYRVTLSPEASDANSYYRINGVAVYERDPEQTSFYNGSVAQHFKTTANAITIKPESNFKDLRNHVIVVGSRKATITDSAKLGNEAVAVGNEEQEFHVAVGVDPFSIYDPTSSNFVGMKRMAVIFDSKVTDGDFARWLVRTVLQYYRNPKTSGQVNHTAVPNMDIRDAIYAVDENHKTLEHMLYVQRFVERWSPDEATVEIDAAAHPELPSYQPREDIDIDTLFVDPADGKGEPVINLGISYKNIYGRSVNNTHLTDAKRIKDFATRTKGSFKPMHHQPITNATSMELTYPAIPETMYIALHHTSTLNQRNTDHDFEARNERRYHRRALVNSPYRHFWDLSWNATTKLPTVSFDFQEGDGTAGVYDKGYYGFPPGSGPGVRTYNILYDYIPERLSADLTTLLENPYYDPETSLSGNLVDISFDLLVSGRVRASVWAFSEALGMEVPVAWLTAPGADPEQPESHWQYMDSGEGKGFFFDGVDNIGLWNTLQSFEYADEMKGSFGEKPMAVGRGFTAWNDKSTNLHTLIGDFNTSDGIKRNFDLAGEPYYTIGRYSQFYVKIEVANDTLLKKDYTNGRSEPRIVESRKLPTTAAMNNVAETYIWQHMSEPTQVAMRLQTWVAGHTWNPGDATIDGYWSNIALPDANVDIEAAIKVGSPVRLTFQPRPHRGFMFEKADRTLDRTRVSAKLTRQVHHKGTIFDQFWTLKGESWEDFHKDWVGDAAGIENKRLTNRMFHNEDHTTEIEDSTWRSGENLETMEWIFDPRLFRQDFGNGFDEPLRYADYEQLEMLPGFDPKHLGGTSAAQRAYMMMAYINHLFYFSAFTMDRSGRRQWCVNSWVDGSGAKRGFIDKTKIVTPTVRTATSLPGDANYKPQYIIDYPRRGADRYLVRTMFTRQWIEPGWKNGTYAGSPVITQNITSAYQREFVQRKITEFNPHLSFDHVLTHATEAVEDKWLREYARPLSGVNSLVRKNQSGEGQARASLEPFSGSINFCPIVLGNWSWNRPGVTNYFKPNPCRDFHPYARYPYTPDLAIYSHQYYLESEDGGYGAYNILETSASNIAFPTRDFSANEQWFGYAFSDAFADNYYNTMTSQTTARRSWFYGARTEMTVEELGATGPRGNADTNEAVDRTKIDAMFDYSKMDNLDRWEQFRGFKARGPYADRSKVQYVEAYYSTSKYRAGAVQPVKPSGVYLFNVGRHADAWLANIHDLINSPVHWTTRAYDFFALRFWHEYVWHSEKHFPVMRNGGAAYMYFGDEYTGVSGWVGQVWSHEGLNRAETSVYYDAGAWTGWRPDGGTVSDRLSWGEPHPVTKERLQAAPQDSYFVAWGKDNESTRYRWMNPFQRAESRPLCQYKLTNILDEYASKARGSRMAVGPALATERVITMNLALPERLSGLV